MSDQEQDQRLDILNSLLTTPHRRLENVQSIHDDMIASDPIFYVRLAAWYAINGEIRDHKEMFVIQLVMSSFEGHRDVGLAMLREMPPYQVTRIVDFIHGYTATIRTSTEQGKKVKVATTKKKVGLYKNIPRSVQTEVRRYLKEREEDDRWFDTSVLTARKSMKRLYALLHINPSDRAQNILFDENPPEDSSLFAVKRLGSASSPAEQAKVIIDNKVPYRVASTVISSMTPTVLLALIEVMSDQELINNIGSLKKRGAFDNPDLKKVIKSKLDKAKKGKRVAALKATEAIKASGVEGDVAELLEEVGDAQIKSRGRITRSTALLIDKSGSMNVAIEAGTRLASMISAVMDAPLYVYCFDTMPMQVQAKEDTLAGWQKAFTGVRASGGTSCGASIAALVKKEQQVEQILMVTDMGENTSPMMLKSLQAYEEKFGSKPSVNFLKTGRWQGRDLPDKLVRNGFEVESFEFNGDYYSLPGIIQYLTQPSRLDLLMTIMETELPERKTI